MLVAAQKGFWNADDATLRDVSQQWVDLLLQNGLPGSGHTRPDHPVFEWIKPKLRADQLEPLQEMLSKALVEQTPATTAPTTLTELNPAQAATAAETTSNAGATNARRPWLAWSVLGSGVLALALLGFYRARFDFRSRRNSVGRAA